MKTLNLFLFFVTALVAATAWAQQTNYNIGSAGGAWVGLNSSARVEGLAESYAAVADDTDTIEINPAGLAFMNKVNWSLTNDFYAQGANLSQATADIPTTFGTFGVGLMYGNFGSVNLYNFDGYTLSANGTFTPSVWNFFAGYALTLEKNLSVGLSGGFLLDSMAPTQVSGWSGNAGLLWIPAAGWKAGVALDEVGVLGVANLPTALREGVSYQFDLEKTDKSYQSLMFTADELEYTMQWNENRLALGGEYNLEDVVFLRAGQQFGDGTGLSGLYGFTAGCGVKYWGLKLDYAFSTRGDFGTLNLLTLSGNL